MHKHWAGDRCSGVVDKLQKLAAIWQVRILWGAVPRYPQWMKISFKYVSCVTGLKVVIHESSEDIVRKQIMKRKGYTEKIDCKYDRICRRIGLWDIRGGTLHPQKIGGSKMPNLWIPCLIPNVCMVTSIVKVNTVGEKNQWLNSLAYWMNSLSHWHVIEDLVCNIFVVSTCHEHPFFTWWCGIKYVDGIIFFKHICHKIGVKNLSTP